MVHVGRCERQVQWKTGLTRKAMKLRQETDVFASARLFWVSSCRGWQMLSAHFAALHSKHTELGQMVRRTRAAYYAAEAKYPRILMTAEVFLRDGQP